MRKHKLELWPDFPQLPSCGPIEARSKSRRPACLPPFRSYQAAAPLKLQWEKGAEYKREVSFRSYQAAAPLKPLSRKKAERYERTFRSYQAAAPLKRALTPVPRAGVSPFRSYQAAAPLKRALHHE